MRESLVVAVVLTVWTGISTPSLSSLEEIEGILRKIMGPSGPSLEQPCGSLGMILPALPAPVGV